MARLKTIHFRSICSDFNTLILGRLINNNMNSENKSICILKTEYTRAVSMCVDKAMWMRKAIRENENRLFQSTHWSQLKVE